MAIDTGKFSIQSLDMDKSWPLALICSSASPPPDSLQSIKALLGLCTKKRRVRVRNGHEQEVFVNEIQNGDVLRVRSGEKVSIDGVIIEGRSNIDESMVTGESMPVSKQAGEKVIGATINETGSFVMRAERIGSETTLVQIVEMIAQAERSRAAIQKLGDTISGYFVRLAP